MNYRIPRTLDNPMRCLGIPIDSLMVFMMVWGGFVMFNIGLYGILLGIFAANVFSRFRSRSIIRKFIRFIYWYFPSEMNFISGVQGHQRKMSLMMNDNFIKNVKFERAIESKIEGKFESAMNIQKKRKK